MYHSVDYLLLHSSSFILPLYFCNRLLIIHLWHSDLATDNGTHREHVIIFHAVLNLNCSNTIMALCHVLLLACSVVCPAVTSDEANSKPLLSSKQHTCSETYQQDFELLSKRLTLLEHDRLQFVERLDSMENQQQMMQAQMASLVASRFDDNGKL